MNDRSPGDPLTRCRPDSVGGDETAWVRHVASLLRYRLKSARGEQLRAVRVDVEGVRGDRGWACLDDADGTVGSAKHPDRWSRLLEVTAQVDEHSSGVVVQVQGRCAVAGSEQADALLSNTSGGRCGWHGSSRSRPGCTAGCPRSRGWCRIGWPAPFPARRCSPSCPVPGQAAASWTSGRCTCSPPALWPSSLGNSGARGWTRSASDPTSSSRLQTIRCPGRS